DGALYAARVLRLPVIVKSAFYFFSSRRRHTRFSRDWSSDVCSSDLHVGADVLHAPTATEERLSLPARLIATVPLEPDRRRVRHEIGRASRRERAYGSEAAVRGGRKLSSRRTGSTGRSRTAARATLPQ